MSLSSQQYTASSVLRSWTAFSILRLVVPQNLTKKLNDSEFTFFDERVSFEEALERCEEEGAALARIGSLLEFDFIAVEIVQVLQLNQSFWIGN